MPSNPSPLLLLELQALGENLNTWGPKLNTLFQMLELAIRGRQQLNVSGPTSITGTYYTATQDTAAWLDLVGSGGTLTIPGRNSVRIVSNSGTGDMTITTGAGASTVVEQGAITLIICNGSDVRQLGVDGMSLKAYIDQELLAASAGELPGQAGNGGKFLHTDGANATWKAVTVALANVLGFPSQAEKAGQLLTTDGAALSWLALATAAEIRAAASKIGTIAAMLAANESVPLTDGATIVPPAGFNFHGTLLAAGRTINPPATLTNGQAGRFALTTGGAWAISWHGDYKRIGNFPATFGAGGPHIFGYFYNGSVLELSYAGQRAA